MNPLNPLPHPRALAHLGDAVYELWIRELAIQQVQKPEALHRYTTDRVQAKTQANLLEKLMPDLSAETQALVKRAQNMPVTSNRRSDQAVYRKATAFEALIGYWYLTDPAKLADYKAQICTLLDQLETDPVLS